MKSKFIFCFLFLISAYFCALFIFSFFPKVGNKFLANNANYGDLFVMSKITDYKIPLPPILPIPTSTPIENAKIITMGDSFFNVSAGYPIFASQLEQVLSVPVNNYNIQGSGEPWRQTNPLAHLKQFSLSKFSSSRILILESVDRGISMRYENIVKISPSFIASTTTPPLALSSISGDTNPPNASIDTAQYKNDVLWLEGWAADNEAGSAIAPVKVTLDGQVIGQANSYLPRPDVASFYKKTNWINSGWNFTQNIKLKPGNHTLSLVFSDPNGNQGTVAIPKNIFVNPFLTIYEFYKNLVNQVNAKIKNHLKTFYYLLQENFVNSFITEKISTIEFKLFKKTSPLTPKYSLNPKLLFYQSEVDFYQHSPSESQIQAIADNYKYLSDQLKSQYNINLLVIPMPTKYTIYHQLAGDQTINNFLPDLYQELTKRKVKFVDLYHPFLQSSDLLYLPSDTHWNKAGITLGVNETLKTLKPLLRQLK
jgi:hypothetical protein